MRFSFNSFSVFQCSEAEERLLKEMGWDELQGEEPLTDEEITNFKHLNGGATLLQQKQQLADRANNNNINGVQVRLSSAKPRPRSHFHHELSSHMRNPRRKSR